MAQIKTNAVVIGRTDYRESDRMLTLFSPDRGRLEVLARRAKSPKSPLLSASELFCSGEYLLYTSGEHASLVSCQVTDAFYPLREDYGRLSHGTLMLEMCRVVVQPDGRYFLPVDVVSQDAKEAHIVLNSLSSSVRPLYDRFQTDPNYPREMFLHSAEAGRRFREDALVIVVDTNRAPMCDSPELLARTDQIVVIDHHRKMEMR